MIKICGLNKIPCNCAAQAPPPRWAFFAWYPECAVRLIPTRRRWSGAQSPCGQGGTRGHMWAYTKNMVCHRMTHQLTSSVRCTGPSVNYFISAAFLNVNWLRKIHRCEKKPPTKKARDQMRNQKKKKSELSEIMQRMKENVAIL